jgi:hypothetical protein
VKTWEQNVTFRRHFSGPPLRENFSPSSQFICGFAAFVPTICLPCPFGRFQWDRLGQPDKWLNAKQVGQHHGFFRQELMEGLHNRM